MVDFDDSQFDLDNQHNKKERCLGIFDVHAVKNEQKSKEEGRPIFDDKVYIRIIVPGSKDEIHRLARDEDKKRFPESWRAFSERREAQATGTPTGMWQELHPSQVAELAAVHVTTVDQLALLSDEAVMQLGQGYMDLRKKAQVFITTRDRAESYDGMKARIAELEAEVARLQALVDNEASGGAESESGKGQPTDAAPKKRAKRKKATDSAL